MRKGVIILEEFVGFLQVLFDYCKYVDGAEINLKLKIESIVVRKAFGH
jgi:hypothetical protein